MNKETDQGFCPKCGIQVYRLERHLKRNRCKALKERRMERGDIIARADRGKNRKPKPDSATQRKSAQTSAKQLQKKTQRLEK